MTMGGDHQYLSSAHITLEHSKTADTRLFYSPSLPLDRAGRLACHVVDDAIDALDFVDDARRCAAEEGHVEGIEVGGHAIDRGHRAQRTDRIVGASVAHHADCAHGQQHGEGLPDVVVEARLADLVEKDSVGLAENIELLAGDGPRAAHGKTWPWKGMTADERVGQAKLTAENAHLILEQFAQRLDELHAPAP